MIHRSTFDWRLTARKIKCGLKKPLVEKATSRAPRSRQTTVYLPLRRITAEYVSMVLHSNSQQTVRLQIEFEFEIKIEDLNIRGRRSRTICQAVCFENESRKLKSNLDFDLKQSNSQ
jgi:hypothetical protein